MKLQLVNDTGIPFSVQGFDSVKVLLPYHSGVLKKAVDILDADNGMIGAVLTDFEIQGLKDGNAQTFWVTAQKGNQIFTFEFPKLLNVENENGRKAIK